MGKANKRYEQLRHDIRRPILPPAEVFLPVEQLFAALKAFPQMQRQSAAAPEKAYAANLPIHIPPHFPVDYQSSQPLHLLADWLAQQEDKPKLRLLFCAETAGRREILENLLGGLALYPKYYTSWEDALHDSAPIGLVIAPLEQGLYLQEPPLLVITEAQLFGQQVMQRRLRRRRELDPETLVRDLTELKIGAPVVHIEHGVGVTLDLK